METTTTPAPSPAMRPAAVPYPLHGRAQAGHQAITVIAIFKLAKALLVFAAAFGLLRMVNKDTAVEAKKLIHVFRMQDDGKIARAILLKANLIQDPQKRIIGGLLVFYGLLFTAEGVGLLLRQRWAEWMTIILTSSLIPYELYEVFHRTNHAGHSVAGKLVPEDQRHLFVFDRLFVLKLTALLVNVGIVWFLVSYVLRNNKHHHATLSNPVPNSGGEGGKAIG